MIFTLDYVNYNNNKQYKRLSWYYLIATVISGCGYDYKMGLNGLSIVNSADFASARF